MKLLITVGVLTNPGGISELYRILDLQNKGFGVYFHIFDKKKETNYIRKVIRLINKYFEFIKKVNDFDYLLINTSLIPNSFFRDSIYTLIAKLKRKKVIIFVHGWDEDFEKKIKNKKILNFIFKNTIAKANGFIILGKKFQNKLIELGVSSNSIFFVFYNSADVSNLVELNHSKSIKDWNEITFLFISRFDKNKGMFLAIDIISTLRKKFPEKKINLILAGDGIEYKRVLEYIQKHEIDNIELTGFVKGETKHKLFLRSDFLLFPTHYGEGMPLSILEGLCYGLPILTSNVGGIPDIIKNYINGFIIPIESNNEIEEYIKKIEMILLNDKFFEEISQNNMNFSKENIYPEIARNNLINFVRSI